ncbi:XdhC family protein [Antarctobacter heliothermus]|uniref:Xanthine dehydrogenase accessory factor n=1 Tax=Antarctobacter heliothermus TaxID=74033 RepID=A0A239EXI1_9RHOB|nr:XdhC family protein [Antarctobacter heliothermus]SNS48534.1 xanthine dehydrogenase accessory factor [Antarctobacter heliothermus]
MDPFDIFDTVATLRATGRPFCVVTVVRTEAATSARPGAKAVVTETGEIIGHLGGACVTRAVREAGQAALDSGAPRVIRVKPSETVVALRDADGAEVYKSGCPSGGTVELMIEPFALPPVICIFGEGPIARAVAGHGGLAGYRVSLAEGVACAGKPLRFEGTDLSGLTLGVRDFVVVASQGQRDLACLQAALDSDAGRVSMVASQKKAAALCSRLLEGGMEEARLGRLKAPAGLDIGAVDPAEIALSIMAEIVAWRREARDLAMGPKGVSTRGQIGG